MLEITETKIKKWASEIKTNNLSLAEQDFRLIHVLKDIYADKFLAERLYLKGGTAINKLFLKETPRLSIDLDFNAIGKKGKIMEERRKIKDRIIELLKEQDMNYKIKTKTRYEQTTIHAKYTPVFGTLQPIKLEISFIERFPVLNKVEKELLLPITNKKFIVTTYSIEEIAATKIRALYDRLKGRDIYDLYHVSRLNPDKTVLRKLVLYYFYRTRKIFNPKIFFKNIESKFIYRKFVDDVFGFIRTDSGFSLTKAIEEVISYYSFLAELDERDKNFLSLARSLLKKSVAKEKLRIIREIKYPLAYLFDGIEISDFSRKATVEDIKVF
ncbi:MAG: nucleotidyl transferase AbiEii/AbiGii toxin family protein [Euryarchaeota archaeon]|nr:nucleotidyl transferase AbiEii/AbiGii toxin family protein [Euryarchaeota archaeon]